MKCLKNVPVFFRLNKINKEYILFFKNVKNITINLYYLYINNPYQKASYNYTNLLNNEIKLSHDLDNTPKYMYIEIICNETLNGNSIFNIKNIL